MAESGNNGKSIWESKAGLNLVENLNVTLNELREYMKTQNEINMALLKQVTSLKEEVISLHNNKQDKEMTADTKEDR